MKVDFNSIVDNYINTRKLPHINIEVVIAEDFFDSYLNRSISSQHADIIENKTWINSLNGSVAFPKNVDGKYNIILSKQYIMECLDNENVNFIGTICHELTHVYDHIEYMKLLGITDFEVAPRRPNYDMFNHWTEFNARKIGYMYLRNYVIDDPYSQEIINHVIQTELPLQINNFFGSYSSTTDGKQQVYSTMQFLGRLKAWKEIYPQIFNQSFLHELLKTNTWMIDLFSFLDENDVLEKAFNNFNQMKDILRTNFTFAEEVV